ncbi:hypothetical protein EYC84_006846 [Monilinia fructicola]|uniref:Uncharacterized protein n=1 Tax=Monilinia fructicola TaxID=38448 RepID=A0A5M9K9L6_MONFR|nr:hypothetical protein EYC84_006846 [Monilinia fructicola]
MILRRSCLSFMIPRVGRNLILQFLGCGFWVPGGIALLGAGSFVLHGYDMFAIRSANFGPLALALLRFSISRQFLSLLTLLRRLRTTFPPPLFCLAFLAGICACDSGLRAASQERDLVIEPLISIRDEVRRDEYQSFGVGLRVTVFTYCNTQIPPSSPLPQSSIKSHLQLPQLRLHISHPSKAFNARRQKWVGSTAPPNPAARTPPDTTRPHTPIQAKNAIPPRAPPTTKTPPASSEVSWEAHRPNHSTATARAPQVALAPRAASSTAAMRKTIRAAAASSASTPAPRPTTSALRARTT